MDYINLPKDYLTSVAKFKNFVLKKDDFNRLFDNIATNLNSLKDEIVNTNNFIFQSSGNINTYFVNIGDSTVEQKTLENLYTDVGFSVDKIFSEIIDYNSIMYIGNDGSSKFIPIVPRSCLTIKNNNIDFNLIKIENIDGQKLDSSFLADSTITFNRFNQEAQNIFLSCVKLSSLNFANDFVFDFGSNYFQAGYLESIFFRSRKSKDWFKNVCVDTKLDRLLHWIITPKSLADNLLLTDENGLKHMHLICYNWSVLIKSNALTASYYKSRYDKRLTPPAISSSGVATNFVVHFKGDEPSDSSLIDLIFQRDVSIDRTGEEDSDLPFFGNIEFEGAGTFDDNLFTNECFVFSGNIPNVGICNSYIGPMYIDEKLLSPTFKITKRMCYEALYADHTKKHARPPLRRWYIPIVILNILRDRFGVTDDDWKWGVDGVYN